MLNVSIFTFWRGTVPQRVRMQLVKSQGIILSGWMFSLSTSLLLCFSYCAQNSSPLHISAFQLLMSCGMFVTKLSLICRTAPKEKPLYFCFWIIKKVCVWTLREGRSVYFHLSEVPSFGKWENTLEIASRRAVSWLQCRYGQQLSRPLQNSPRRLLSQALRDAVLASASSFSFQAFEFGSVCLGYAFQVLWSFSVLVE